MASPEKSANYKNLEQTLEVFQINKRSTKEEVENMVQWIWKCYNEQSISTINVIVKRLTTFDTNNSMQNNSSLINYSQADAGNTSIRNTNSQILNKIDENQSQAMSPERSKASQLVNDPNMSQSNISQQTSRSEQIQPIFKEAGKLYQDKQFEEAIAKYKEVLNLCVDEQSHKQFIITSQVQIGSSLLYLQKVDESIVFLQNGLNLVENTENPNKGSLQFIHSTLGSAYFEKRDNQKMIEHWKKSVELMDDTENEESLKSQGHIYNNLGMAYSSQGNYDEAIRYFEKSIEIYKKIFGEEDLSVGNRLNNLADAYANKKDYQQALNYFEQSLVIKRKKFNTDNEKSIANTLSNIGLTYFNMKGDYYHQAVVQFQKAIEIYQVLYENDLNKEGKGILSSLYLQLADTNKALKQIPQALDNYKIAFKFKKESIGLYHKTSIHIASTYAQTLYKSQKLEESVEIFKELLDAQKHVLGEKHIKVGQTLNNLGTVLSKLKQYEKSYEAIGEALDIFKSNKNVDPSFIVKAEKNRESLLEIIKNNENK